MTKTVLIGKGRRLTLSELLSVTAGDAHLEWQAQSQAANDDKANDDDTSGLNDKFQSLSIEDGFNYGNKLDKAESIAFLTVLALHVAQGKAGMAAHEAVAETLVHWVREGAVIPLPANVEACVDLLGANGQALPLVMVERCLDLSVAALAVARASRLSAAALPIACLSIDSLGLSKAVLPYFQEVHFDVSRPHRSMVTAAAISRAMLNGSRFETTETPSACFTTLPQYQGPCTADLRASLATLELEVNSVVQEDFDRTIVNLALEQARQSVNVLLAQSRQRQGLPAETTSSLSLPELVDELQTSLEEEAAAASARMTEELTKAAEQAKLKDAEKQARAAQLAGPNSNNPDEFAGMSEEKKQKILKKRAEKEAKAAAKKKAKESKGVSLFGTGAAPLQQILKDSNGQLTLEAMDAMQDLCEKLLSGGVQRKPKIPKGTRDYLPEQMMIRSQAFGIIRRVFEAHGAVEIDTPVFELKETLTGKYGEDSKLIYDLADQGGELLALRYDLTVPFARFLAVNSVGNIKRFHIGKVYRRDQPALARGRYREFYQCDFDIAGTYGRMVPDSECICVVCDILDALPIGDFGIKLNHRRLLDAILDICGVPADKFRTICSAVDKLDKEPWSAVKREMVEDKGLKEDVADKIGEFVLNKGAPWEMYNELMDSKKFGNHKAANEAMDDLRILFEYLEAMDKLKYVSFDLSLARGLDYYTGVIYEAVCMSGDTQVGSIGGGGRYDNLVSRFQEAGKETPCVGVSVGIERVFTIMEARLREQQGGSIKQPNVDVLVASAGEKMMKEKMRIARILWDGKISAEFSQQEHSKLKNDLRNALDREIPFVVIVGEAELAENKCNVKDLKARTEDTIPIPELVAFVRSKGAIPVGCEFAAELLQQESSSS